MIVGMMFASVKEQVLFDTHYLSLEEKLLQFGGHDLVYVPAQPELLDFIRDWEQGFDPAEVGIKQVKGHVSQCHENVAQRYRTQKGKKRIVHGYGLSEDGLWRSHSWLLDEGGAIVETTVPRTRYYGVILEGPLLAWFLQQ